MSLASSLGEGHKPRSAQFEKHPVPLTFEAHSVPLLVTLNRSFHPTENYKAGRDEELDGKSYNIEGEGGHDEWVIPP